MPYELHQRLSFEILAAFSGIQTPQTSSSLASLRSFSRLVWQRTLVTIYGVNIGSVAVIVTVLMLGLGLSNLAGGKLSTHSGVRLLRR